METQKETREMKVSPLMRILLKHKKRGLVFQGGSRSSKTYSILQYFILKSISGEWHHEVIDIVRDTTPVLKRSVMFDFFRILEGMNLYDFNNHNKTDSTYHLGTNLIRFFSLDEQNKVRGPGRDRVYLNEALHLKRIDVMQILLRTHKQFYMDYNPSEEFSWVYDEILMRDDVNFHISTYLDNPFLTRETIDEIKRLEKIDPNLWRIYGLGQRGISEATIYKNWEYADKPFEDYEGQVLYGMDFGFNDPTALVKVKYHKEGIYMKQLIYKSELTPDLVLNELNKLE